MTTIEVATGDAMEHFGARLASVLRAGDIVSLSGPLGAGKTTLTRGLGEALGVRGPVTSPTFVLARTHPSLRGGPALIHVDAYRLGSALELDDLDLDLDSAVTVVEWGTDAVPAITDTWLEVSIARPTGVDDADASVESLADAPRRVDVRGVGERWRAADLGALVR